MTPTITILEFHRAEWSRMANAAEHDGRPDVAYTYRIAASFPAGTRVHSRWYDGIQDGWADWLCFNVYP